MENQLLVSDLFYIHSGSSLELNKLIKCKDGINFISRTSKNNGVSAMVRPINGIEPYVSGMITVAAGGSVLSSFVQNKPFYTAYHVFCLEPINDMTLIEKLFYCMCIKSNQYKYSFGRQANKTLSKIKLPNKIPHWVNEFQIPELSNMYKSKNNTSKNFDLCVNKWQYVKIVDLFDVKGTKTTPKNKLLGKPLYSFITTKSINNGTEKFSEIYTEFGCVLTIDSAVIGTCFYQKNNFSASDHVEKLIPKFDMNVYIAMFLTTIINKEQYRYSYGRKSSQDRIKNSSIKLPCKNNVPDWKYMENYVKSLPYSINLKE